MLAAIGSAVGLGNLWRFPYVAATNGGGAFLVPYFFAIITAGIPILILEYTMGKTYRGGAPVTWARINKKFEWLGWFQVMVAFVIGTYYFAIIVWVLSYVGFSFTQAWGADPSSFFVEYLGLTDSALNFGGIRTNLILPFVIIWAIVGFVMYKGVSKGIETICKICLPILMLLTVILVVRGITLPGAVKGLEYMFKPDWSMLADSSVWVAAYGQIFYSLSIGFAIMLAYSSYLPKDGRCKQRVHHSYGKPWIRSICGYRSIQYHGIHGNSAGGCCRRYRGFRNRTCVHDIPYSYQ